MEIARYRKLISQAAGKVQRRSQLQTDLRDLRTRYSNYVGKINDIIIPRNIDDVMRGEFEKVDRLFGSEIRQTRFSPLMTNEIHNTLDFTLNNVKCNWQSLHATLRAIETAGHLVGFESMRISAAADRQTGVAVTAYVDVKSFIFPGRGTQPWSSPDYTGIADQIGPDIFAWPLSMAPPTPTPPSLPPNVKPPWAAALKLTALVRFPDQPHAVIQNKSDRKEYRYTVGSLISNSMNAIITVESIDVTNEFVILASGGQTTKLELREYRTDMFATFEKPFSLFGPTPMLPTYDDKEPAEPAPTGTFAAVTIPPTYDKPLGGYAEAQLKTGVIILPIDQYVQRRYRLPSEYGLLVYNLQKLGTAEKAGLQKRDIILSIGDKRVDSRDAFTYLLNDAFKADKESVPITVLRGDQRLNLTLSFK